MHEMVEIPVPFQTPEFKRLFLLAKIGKFTPDELKEYEKSLTRQSPGPRRRRWRKDVRKDVRRDARRRDLKVHGN